MSLVRCSYLEGNIIQSEEVIQYERLDIGATSRQVGETIGTQLECIK